MANLFISYSRKDINFARKLTETLNVQGLDTWIDWEGIAPTRDWWQEIEKGIEEADIFLFLLSPDSAKSEVCTREIDHAAKNGKRLIPVVVRDIHANDTPAKIRALNWIFLRENDNFDIGFNKLITAIKTDYEWVQTHRQLQVKALEWEKNNYENSFLLRGKELKDAELQLVSNSSKEPNPTDLQREYILKSRQISDRQRRIITGVAIAGGIALTVLTVVAIFQANRATDNAAEADRNSLTAQAASTLAVANEKLAEERANIALARQLAAQAQEIYSKGDSREDTAVLLAAQSMRLFATIEAAQILQTNTLAKTISRLSDVCIGISEEGIRSSAVSPDGEYIVSSTFGGLCLWEASTGKVIARIVHDGYVSSVSFSPDGKFIVSGSDDSTIRVWEVSSGREVMHMDNGSEVVSIDFSPDGTKIASAGEDSAARVWDLFTGSEIARMSHQGWVSSVSFSPDGKFIVSGSADGTARVWNADTGDEISQMAHGGMVWSVEFSPDGRTVVSGSEDGTARVWDARSGVEITRMTHHGFVISVRFSPNGKLVLSGGCADGYFDFLCTKGTAIAWDPDTGREISQMTHDGLVQFVAFSPDGEHAMSTGDDATVRIWEPFTSIETARMTHISGRSNAAFSPDSKTVVSGISDVRVWNINAGSEIARITYDKSPVQFAVSPDTRKVVTGGCDQVNETNNCLQGSARVWEVISGKELARLTFGNIVTSVAFSTDGKYIASGSNDGTARVWQTDTGEETSRVSNYEWISTLRFSPDGMYVVSGGCYKRLETNSCAAGVATVWEAKSGNQISYQTFKNTVNEVLFSPNGKFVAAASVDELIIWEALTGKQISEFINGNRVTAIAFSPDSKLIALASSITPARVWDLDSKKEIPRTEFYGSSSSLAFSSDGKYIATGGCDIGYEDLTCTKGSARVWEAISGKEIAVLTHDNEAVTSIAFSPDGKYIISGGDNTARVWNIATKNEVARMTHDSWISSVEFSPNGQYVVSGSNDGTARVWAWRSEDLIANGCDRLTRNLTRAEWKQYVGDAMPYQAVCSNPPIEPEPTAAATP